jgi:hypothetical protein
MKLNVDDRVELYNLGPAVLGWYDGMRGTFLGYAVDNGIYLPGWNTCIILLDAPLPHNRAIVVIDSCVRRIENEV